MKLFEIKTNHTNFNLSSFKFNDERFYLLRSETLPYDDSWLKSMYSVKKIKHGSTEVSQMKFDIGEKELVNSFLRENLVNNSKLYLPEDFRYIFSKYNSSFDSICTASKLFYVNQERRFIPGIFKINFKYNTIVEDKKWNDIINQFAKNDFEKNWSFCFDKKMQLIIIKSIDPFDGFLVNEDGAFIKHLKFIGKFNHVKSNHYKDINYSLSGNLIRINHNTYFQLIKTKDLNNTYSYFLIHLKYEKDTIELLRISKKLFAGDKLFICSVEREKKLLYFFGGAFDKFPIYYSLEIEDCFI